METGSDYLKQKVKELMTGEEKESCQFPEYWVNMLHQVKQSVSTFKVYKNR